MRPALPALADVQALPLLLRAVVPPEYRDDNDHMNVRFYLALFDDAGYPMIENMGLTPEYHQAHQTGGFDLEHHLRYLAEVRIGETVAIHWRLLTHSPKRMHYLMFMVNETRPSLAATFECVNSFADLRVRKTAPFPPEVQAQLAALHAAHSALAWQAPACGVMSA